MDEENPIVLDYPKTIRKGFICVLLETPVVDWITGAKYSRDPLAGGGGTRGWGYIIHPYPINSQVPT